MTYEKLPEDFKKKWVEALRSGEYKQGRHQLYDFDAYCCLGVGYKVATGKTPPRRAYIPLDCEAVPKQLIEANPLTNRLSAMNDNGQHFSEIADWIEKNL